MKAKDVVKTILILWLNISVLYGASILKRDSVSPSIHQIETIAKALGLKKSMPYIGAGVASLFLSVDGMRSEEIVKKIGILATALSEIDSKSLLNIIYLWHEGKTVAEVGIPTIAIKKLMQGSLSMEDFFSLWMWKEYQRSGCNSKGECLFRKAKRVDSVDLDGDGKKEIILLVPVNRFSKTYFLAVIDSSHRFLWSGPISEDLENPLIFSEKPKGFMIHKVAYDNKSGSVEIIALSNDTSWRKKRKRVLIWSGNGFELKQQWTNAIKRYDKDKVNRGTIKYLGCYKDAGDPFSIKGRDLHGYGYMSRALTPEACFLTCARKGFRYAGLQYARSCVCDNHYGKYGKADNCNMPCTGDKSKICGGSWANNVYDVSSIKAPPITYSGMERNIDRPGGDYKNVELPYPDPNLCKQACEKDPRCQSWTYQEPRPDASDFTECWLKNTVSDPVPNKRRVSGVKADRSTSGRRVVRRFDRPRLGAYRLDWCYKWDSGCGEEAANAFCREMGYGRAASWQEDEDIGDRTPTKIIGSGQICSKHFCDGFKYIECAGRKKNGRSSNIHGTSYHPPQAHTNTSNKKPKNVVSYLGCYKDKGDPYGTRGRDLSEAGYLYDNSMSVERCIALCGKKGYRYAGVQYGNSCFCGNRYGSYGPAKNCDMKCAGNAREICGGFWSNSVYEVSRRGAVPGTVHTGVKKTQGTQPRDRGVTKVANPRSGRMTKIGRGMEQSIDRPSGDYRNFDLLRPDPELCREACEKDSRCKAWTYVKPNTFQGPRPRCWLKNVVPPPKKNEACVSGVKAKSSKVNGVNKSATRSSNMAPGDRNIDNCKKYYKLYVDRYNRVTRLMSSGKGNTEKAKEAYKVYKQARQLYLSCENRSQSKTHSIEKGKSKLKGIYNTAEAGKNFIIDNTGSLSKRTGREEGMVLIDTADMLSNAPQKKKPVSIGKTGAKPKKEKRCAGAYYQYLGAYQSLTQSITDSGVSDLTLLKYLHSYRQAWQEYRRCTGAKQSPSRHVKGSESTYEGLCSAEFKAFEENYERLNEGMKTLDDLSFLRLRRAYLRAKKSYESCMNRKEIPRQHTTARGRSPKKGLQMGEKKAERPKKRDIIVYAGSKLNNALIATRRLPSGEPDGYTITDHLPNGSTPFYLFVYYEGIKPTDRIGAQWYYRPFGGKKETLLFEEKGGRLPADEGVFSAGPISIEGGSFPSGEYHLILTLNGKKEIEKFFTIGEGQQ